MLTRDEYDILFASWLNQYGVLKTSPKSGIEFLAVPGDPEERREAFGHLINTLINKHGYAESDFGNSFKNILVEQSVNPEYDKKRLEIWRKMVRKDIDEVLGLIFEKDFEEFKPAPKTNKKQEKRLQEAIQKTEELPDSYFGPETTGVDDEEIKLDKPLDDSIFDSIPDIDYPMLTHEELVAKLEKEISDREREENGDE